jgi:hypothetical protein
LKDTIKSLIQSARTYTTSGALSQARAILGRVQEWIEIYLKKKFDLLPEKAELGNSLAMLEARLGNTKLVIAC